MTPSEKAAAILALAGEENAAKLIQNLSNPEVKKILRTLSRLPSLSEDDISKIAAEFLAIITNLGSYEGNFTLEKAKKILQTANLASKDSNWIDSLSDSFLLEEIRRILNMIDEKTLANWLKQEHPQTISLILAIATPQKSTVLFKYLQEYVRCEILLRISQMNHVETVELENIYEELNKLQKNLQFNHLSLDGIEKITQMLQAANGEFRNQLLAGIKTKDPQLAERFAHDLLAINKLAELTPAHLSILCANLTDATLTLGLRLENQTVKEKFLSAVAKKRRHLIESEWEGGKVPKKEVETAVAAIIKKALELKEKGKIVFPWEETLV